MHRRVPLVPSSVRWLVVASLAVGILAFALAPGGVTRRVTGPLGVVGLDKYLHAVGFGVFAVGLAYALATWPSRRTALAVFTGTVAFGLAVELLQLPLPYRTFSWLDLAADAVGATVVAVAWRLVADRLRFRRIAVDLPAVE